MIKFIVGLLIGVSVTGAGAQLSVTCGQGQLTGYVVQNQNGEDVCKDPMVWNQFRSETSYIVCE